MSASFSSHLCFSPATSCLQRRFPNSLILNNQSRWAVISVSVLAVAEIGDRRESRTDGTSIYVCYPHHRPECICPWATRGETPQYRSAFLRRQILVFVIFICSSNSWSYVSQCSNVQTTLRDHRNNTQVIPPNKSSLQLAVTIGGMFLSIIKLLDGCRV